MNLALCLVHHLCSVTAAMYITRMKLQVCKHLLAMTEEQHAFLSVPAIFQGLIIRHQKPSCEIFCLWRSSRSSFQVLTCESSPSPLEATGWERGHRGPIDLNNMALELERAQGTSSSSKSLSSSLPFPSPQPEAVKLPHKQPGFALHFLGKRDSVSVPGGEEIKF